LVVRYPRALVALVLALLCAAVAQPSRAGSPLHLDLYVELDPAGAKLNASGTLTLSPGRSTRLRLIGGSEPPAFELDGRSLRPVREAAGPAAAFVWQVRAPADAPASITFRYALALQRLDGSLDHRQVLGLAQPVAGAQGAFLPGSSAWYPQPEGAELTYRIRISVPPGYRAVTPGKLVDETVAKTGAQATFESPRPLPGIDLMAGPYTVGERMLELAPARAVRVRTYFHAELQGYSDEYLRAAARYLARYDRQIGPYAHPAYSVVSAPLPTGFGMPGIAYLGREVIRLPFIPATSLGHEVLHDWWGNGVYPDYAKGNWSEGLTTFLADYAFKEEDGTAAAQAMRLGWLRDYAAVPTERDRPLSAFVSRRHGADQAVGYNKTAFVFFMLRDLIGEERFGAGLRSFWQRYSGRVASWDDLQREFESVAQRDLGEFFRQWVSRPGAPVLQLVAARRLVDAAGERVRVRVRQHAPAYRLMVPLRIHTASGGAVDTLLPMAKPEEEIEFGLPARAISVSIDPDVRLFRRLDREEIAPTLRQVMLNPRTRVVAGDDPTIRKIVLSLARATLEHDAGLLETNAPGSTQPLLVVGLHGEIGSILQRFGLPGMPGALDPGGAAYAYAWRTEQGRDFAVVSAPDAAALEALARPLPHLGAQSYALFEGGRSVARGVWPRPAPRAPVEDR